MYINKEGSKFFQLITKSCVKRGDRKKLVHTHSKHLIHGCLFILVGDAPCLRTLELLPCLLRSFMGCVSYVYLMKQILHTPIPIEDATDVFVLFAIHIGNDLMATHSMY